MLQRTDSLIVTQVTRFLVPFIQLFSFYVIFHGHYSPGGGFQGGALLAASLIIQRIVFGKESREAFLSTRQAVLLGVAGLLIYVITGAISWVEGGNFLDYANLPFTFFHETPALRAFGILLIEIGVGCAVVGTLVALFDFITKEEDK